MSREYADGKLIEFDNCEIIHVTEKGGVLVYIEDADDKIWFFQDMIHEDSEIWKKGQVGKLVVSTDVAMKKGLI